MLIIIIGTFLVLLLRGLAGMYNAKMDAVKDHFESSIYMSEKDIQWYSPNTRTDRGRIIDGGWKLKHDVERWRELASKHLFKPIYFIVNKIKPAWDPFSDFWHYSKFKMFISIWIAAILFALTIYFSKSYIPIIIISVFWELVSIWSFNLYYNKKLKKK